MSPASRQPLSDPVSPSPAASFSLTHQVRDAWDGVFADLRAARRRIDFEQYMVGDGVIGRALVDLCADKARQGVRVRLLLDAIGSRRLRASGYWRRVVEAGGQVRFYNVLTLRHLLHWPPVIHRDHRKTIVVDEAVTWVGGVCFDARMTDWRDSMARLHGVAAEPVIGQVSEAFEASWGRAEAVDRRVRRAGDGDGDDAFAYRVNAPRPPLCRELYDTLLDQIRAARQSVRLTTPYFLPERRFLRHLIRARARGVRITLMVPAVSDHPAADVISQGVLGRLRAHGVEVRYFAEGMTHAKVAIVDEAWGMVGSLNLDRLSFRINLEGAIVSRHAGFVAALSDQMDRDLEHCRTEPSDSGVHPLIDPLLRLAGRWI